MLIGSMLLLYVYCFIGWCFESSYVSLRVRCLVNRGFMQAPFLPLYGIGVLLILISTRPFWDNFILSYIVGATVATLWELTVGAGMEWLFKVKYWDYSNQHYHYKGHICLSSSIAWGFLSLVIIHVLHEPIVGVVERIPDLVGIPIIVFLTIFLGLDFLRSFKQAMEKRRIYIHRLEHRI